MKNKDLDLLKKLQALTKTPSFKEILNYFAHSRSVVSRSSDVYSVLKYASQNGDAKFNAVHLKEFFRSLHAMGIGRLQNSRQFEWLEFNPINVCKVALGEESILSRNTGGSFDRNRQRKFESQMLIGNFTQQAVHELSTCTEAQLVEELERRGWKVSMQRKKFKS
jgi:hypothetical protein